MPRTFVEPLVDGHRVLPSLLRDLAAATRDIHVSMFLIFRDPVGEEVASVLEERARAGVTVRVLLNVQKTGLGDPFSTGEKRMIAFDPNVHHNPLDVKPLCERLVAAGVRVQDTEVDYDAAVTVADPRVASVAAQIASTVDLDVMHIDHRKLVIIDGIVGYCGGANIGAQYMFHVPFDASKNAREEGQARKDANLPEPWWKWHDSLTRFEGAVVPDLEAEFRTRWLLDGGDEYTSPAPLDESPVRTRAGLPVDSAVVYTNEPNDQPNAIRELYLRAIAEARHSIFIENPYLYHPRIVEALCDAKRTRPELRVTLVVPQDEHNDNSFAQDAQQHHYEAYLACGIEVYEYQNHFNHLKLAVFDERWSLHASTNLNYRSLEDDRDFEAGVWVDDVALAQRLLADVRDVDLAHSIRIGTEHVAGMSLAALRIRTRDPRTLLLLSRREL